ncbi:hypothetical protein HD554DRAFT_2203462 [Boletus coccyginus]|nr:hypothetical protein HD554DRAFT_2203462 [Boletus coccyginus]
MWTGNWWWEIQTWMPVGATVLSIILASNKTKLSQFKGDKIAWLVYLIIGNVFKHIHLYPVLATFIGNHSEQCLIVCCAKNQCPKCHMPVDQLFVPFWTNLPHSNIFTCITSDILHQLHQGIIKDHLKKCISYVKQWTGADHKQLQQVFMTTLVGLTACP